MGRGRGGRSSEEKGVFVLCGAAVVWRERIQEVSCAGIPSDSRGTARFKFSSVLQGLTPTPPVEMTFKVVNLKLLQLISLALPMGTCWT